MASSPETQTDTTATASSITSPLPSHTQLCGHLTLWHPLVIMVARNRIRRAVEHALRIHLFELRLPTLVLHPTRQRTIPVIAKHQQCLSRKATRLHIILHRLCHTRLRLEVFVAPVAYHQQTRTSRRAPMLRIGKRRQSTEPGQCTERKTLTQKTPARQHSTQTHISLGYSCMRRTARSVSCCRMVKTLCDLP